jgi:glycosyltransferase involved in cell wall biosynthesis
VSDGLSGILITPGDVDRLAESIARICKDRGLAEEMGRQGWEIARTRFTEGQLADALVSLWTDAST